ncbi:TetR/AcrR family transcriptional regulator [Microbacterium stercoris]|uniref:TetR family transcriptional regulator n=1 Tax=Microbacterium stercoris TaxID=2820289 RepID=A0A939QGE8_9MICO|nr:TetR/AcrR family transcriptional regulator [Microbacterium stercoris]MBO3662479.1 TetR family transcriptional regulator [Microbacterium stercoris]MBO3664471.1 TetR family transcriptional regulator [Microbacterium stercoris]
MGRTSDARERLLAAALSLFAEKSYSAVGIAEICARAGVQKGSFYYFFPSKEALALATIEDHWIRQKSDWASILHGEGSPLERLHRLFDATTQIQADALAGTGTVTGCLFGNLALEVGAISEPIRERLQGVFAEQVEMITSHLEQAVASGEIEPVDTVAAAKSIVAQLEGLILFAKLFNDPAQLDAMWASSLRLVGVTERVS